MVSSQNPREANMRIKAAVVRSYKEPISVEEIELDPPKDGEILVKTKYTGFCHSDFSFIAGRLGFPTPFVPGHEASGIVVDVGPNVKNFKKGDHVIATWMIACGRCKNCVSGRAYICTTSHMLHSKGSLLDGTSRLRDLKGERLNHIVFVSGFADYMVIPEEGAVKIADDFPLDEACLLGCCIPTGFGAVFNVANVKPGDSVAIWGMGGVGLNVVQGARLRGAMPIIGVDIEGSKERIARQFGVTHFIDSSKEDPVPIIQELTGGGADFCFEVIGDPGAQLQAYWSLAIGGKLILIGLTHYQETSALPVYYTPIHNKDILGVMYGNIRTHVDIPKLADLIRDGRYISPKHLITKKFKLEEINDVYRTMAQNKIIGRWVCEFE